MALLGTQEVARRLGISRIRAIQLITRDKILKAVKIGQTWVVDEADLEQLSWRRTPGRPKGAKNKRK
jgi:hypothetical protein